MEAFESFVALAMEEEGLVVSSAVKFPVTRRTAKSMHTETQTHGFEVDLVGASAKRLVLASVKSFFGSRGVVARHVDGTTGGAPSRLYAMLNDSDVRDQVIAGARERYGYSLKQIELRLYVGRFAGPTKGENEREFATGPPGPTSGRVRSRSSASRLSSMSCAELPLASSTATTPRLWPSRCWIPPAISRTFPRRSPVRRG